MNLQVFVAMHKPYPQPSDSVYIPLHVGRSGKPPLCAAGDDTGDNLSAKNANYCELTGLYWMWKNVNADYLGLVHYRRYFAHRGLWGDKWKRILSREELQRELAACDVLLPKQRHYVIETNRSQYIHAHNEADLQVTKDCIRALCPEYLPAFEHSMKQTHGHRFNMLVMKKTLLDAYCTWLFALLFEIESRLDISQYSAADARVFGYLSERLLDVWLFHNKVAYRELPVLFMEPVNWVKKGTRFVLRKLGIHHQP
ncbi:MAG: DUF4422 domain-containing protein [Clostridia bacterium]